jgi:hypothetical protein
MSVLNVLGVNESSSVKGFVLPDYMSSSGIESSPSSSKEIQTLSSRTPPTKETALIHQPIVISPDSKSPEAELSRKASQIEKQMAVDTKYDATIERFENLEDDTNTLKKTLLLLVIVGGLVYSLRSK